MEKSRLAREKQLREELEHQKDQLENRLQQLQDESRAAHEALVSNLFSTGTRQSRHFEYMVSETFQACLVKMAHQASRLAVIT